MSFLFAIAIFLQLFAQNFARWYCYSPLGDLSLSLLNSDLVIPDCVEPSEYKEDVQLCCSQTEIRAEALAHVQDYDTIPVPENERIPRNCRRALHLRGSNIFECGSSTKLCQSSTYQLCCRLGSGNTDCPQLGQAQHRAFSFTGTSLNQLGNPCLRNAENSGQCRPGEFFNAQLRCCELASVAAQQGVPGSRTGNILGTLGLGRTNTRCQDRAVPGKQSDCPATKNLCDDPLYRDLMTAQCPFTCKRCGQTAGSAQFANVNVPIEGGGCFDRVGANGLSDCPSRESFCRIPVWSAFMRQECPFTCKVCTGDGGFATIRPPSRSSVTRVPTGLALVTQRPIGK